MTDVHEGPKPYNPDEQHVDQDVEDQTLTGTMTPEQAEVLAKVRDVEKNMLAFAEDFKYPTTLPRGPKGDRGVLMLDYLYPDLQHILAAHFISRGWRRHDDLAIIKPRKIVGGLFDDLVTYVPVDEPDAPIVVPPPPVIDDSAREVPELSDVPWSGIKPVVTDTFEERPDDD